MAPKSDKKIPSNRSFLGKWPLQIVLLTVSVVVAISLTLRSLSTEQLIDYINKLPGAVHHPDINRNIFELIESRGFRYESHFVTSEDGYILQMVRIINPHAVNAKKPLKPVLLHHGFQGTGAVWLVAANGTLNKQGQYIEYDENGNPREASQTGNTLGFVLASKNYDVWLANYRGSVYSMNHTKLSIDSWDFWKFSADEMVKYDLPAEIDYILKTTGQKSLSYIGHSQGNAMMLGLLSENVQYSKKIRPFIALSPVFYLHKITSAVRYLKVFSGIDRDYPHRTLFTPNGLAIFRNLCANRFLQSICYHAFYQLTGLRKDQIDWNRLPVYIANLPGGASSWNLVQLLQGTESKESQLSHFDYGSEENRKLYGQPQPPIYDPSKIDSNHIALIYAQDDCFNHLDNIELLKKNLKVKLIEDYLVPNKNYDHMELKWAKDVGQTVNVKILEILSKY